jgi:hypothetical protein
MSKNAGRKGVQRVCIGALSCSVPLSHSPAHGARDTSRFLYLDVFLPNWRTANSESLVPFRNRMSLQDPCYFLITRAEWP